MCPACRRCCAAHPLQLTCSRQPGKLRKRLDKKVTPGWDARCSSESCILLSSLARKGASDLARMICESRFAPRPIPSECWTSSPVFPLNQYGDLLKTEEAVFEADGSLPLLGCHGQTSFGPILALNRTQCCRGIAQRAHDKSRQLVPVFRGFRNTRLQRACDEDVVSRSRGREPFLPLHDVSAHIRAPPMLERACCVREKISGPPAQLAPEDP